MSAHAGRPTLCFPAATRAGWLAILASLAVGCSGVTSSESSSDQPSPSEPRGSGLIALQEERTPIDDPDAALLEEVELVFGNYPIGGTWASPLTELDFTPKDAPFDGELVVTRREGKLINVGSSGTRVEVPVMVEFRTEDGAFAESVEGTVLLTNHSEATTEGTPVPFRAELSAVIDLSARSGSFSFTDDPTWTFVNATLKAELTPYGTRGTVNTSMERKQPPEPGSGQDAVAPSNSLPLLIWHGGEGCIGESGSDPKLALYPAPTEARQTLDAALDSVALETYPATYADGTETRIAIELEPLAVLCATDFWASYWHFVTRAHLRTDDGRLDVSVGVTLDPSFAQMHYNTQTELPWAYPPSLASEQIGVMDTSISDYAQVGIESWFDLTPEPAGWVKVLGYADGACEQCDDAGGCSECAWDARVELLSLFIGAARASNL